MDEKPCRKTCTTIDRLRHTLRLTDEQICDALERGLIQPWILETLVLFCYDQRELDRLYPTACEEE